MTPTQRSFRENVVRIVTETLKGSRSKIPRDARVFITDRIKYRMNRNQSGGLREMVTVLHRVQRSGSADIRKLPGVEVMD